MQIEEEIQNIDKKVYAMLDAVIDSCKVAFGYYLDKDRGYDAGIEIDDDKINLFERETESLCMQILLREKVYSGDLRDIIGNFRLVEDVERIGDQAYDIKKTTDRIKNLSDDIKVVKGMDELVAVVQKMVQDALYCCVKMNVEQGRWHHLPGKGGTYFSRKRGLSNDDRQVSRENCRPCHKHCRMGRFYGKRIS